MISVTHFWFGSVAVNSRLRSALGDGVRSVSAGSQHSTLFASDGKCRFPHQPGNPFARDALSLLLQLHLDAWTPISASVRDKDLFNFLRSSSIFALAPAGRTLTPGIQATDPSTPRTWHMTTMGNSCLCCSINC